MMTLLTTFSLCSHDERIAPLLVWDPLDSRVLLIYYRTAIIESVHNLKHPMVPARGLVFDQALTFFC